MKKIAHIIHPVRVAKTSDLIIAQPITFETMRRAAEFAVGTANIALFAVQAHDEDPMPLPGCFIRTPDIKRSVTDIKTFKKKRKLSLIKDILDNLYHCTGADYLIYTNVDIAVQPYFYQVVSRIIEEGHDAFIINRRTIPDTYTHPDEIPLMYAEAGEKHKGWDCFVFKRCLYPKFTLGTACIGTGWIGRVMIANMASLSQRFKIFTDLHATFHIGNEKSWKTDEYNDYLLHNQGECLRILTGFEQEFGPFDRDKIPGRFLRLLKKEQAK
jgi:hypothetical protein